MVNGGEWWMVVNVGEWWWVVDGDARCNMIPVVHCDLVQVVSGVGCDSSGCVEIDGVIRMEVLV